MRLNDNYDACIPGKAHYWKLCPAVGKLSRGICKYCNQNRMFQNFVESQFWHVSKKIRRATYEGRI